MLRNPFWFSFSCAEYSTFLIFVTYNAYQMQIQTSCLHPHVVLFLFSTVFRSFLNSAFSICNFSIVSCVSFCWVSSSSFCISRFWKLISYRSIFSSIFSRILFAKICRDSSKICLTVSLNGGEVYRLSSLCVIRESSLFTWESDIFFSVL